MKIDPHDYKGLRKQIALQKKQAWDLETAVDWSVGVDLQKPFLPLDHEAIAFPGASSEQTLALSQWIGLVVNATISEMEDALPNLKYHGWEKIIRAYPVNPEIKELGELFFEEEAKHAKAFSRYLDAFCQEVGVEPHELKKFLPRAFGSFFQAAITKNAEAGGHAFWWVVAAVEEVSINIFKEMLKFRGELDPLFYQLHRRHLEEEARHANYAYLMLQVIQDRPANIRRRLFQKTDFLFSQLVAKPWVIKELSKFFEVGQLSSAHPFFKTLESCVPLCQNLSIPELSRRMFYSAPYVSWILNPNWARGVGSVRKDQGALPVPFKDVSSVTLDIPKKSI